MKKISITTKQFLLTATAITALAGSVEAQTILSTPGSDADKLLNFNSGAAHSTVQATFPVAFINPNPSAKTGTSAGWDTSARGALNVLNLLTTRATTGTSSSGLTFGTNSTGLLDDLASVSLAMNWSASADITGSDSWSVGSGDTVTYSFDLNINNGLLNLGNIGLLPILELDIESANSGNLFSGALTADILGLIDLSNTSGSASVTFDYDPTVDGELSIIWSASQPVAAGLLGGGVQDVYKISNGSMSITATGVPEPSSALLVGLGAMTLIARRRK